MTVDYEVLVIGAGAAGIGASLTLTALGIEHAVIEASDRVGGRAWTDQTTLGTPFDLGASFIHAVDQGNPWADIALTFGHRVFADTRERTSLDAAGVIDPAGAKNYLAMREAAFAKVQGHLARTETPMAADLGLTGPWSGPAAKAVGPWLAGTDNDQLDAADWYGCHSGEDWLLPGGYGRLVETTAAGIKAQLNTPIRKITVTGDHVIAESATGKRTARQVILTASIGVLQAELINFEPQLPARALAALDRLAMGNLTKVGLELQAFEPPFDRHQYLQIDEASPTLPLYFLRPANSPSIMAFLGGSAVAELSKLGADAVIDAAIEPLAARLGQHTVERLFGRRLATNWDTQPWIRGSYSNGLPGCGNARARLREPWHERLVYAGEANAPDGWQATVAGAYLAGRNAALSIAARK